MKNFSIRVANKTDIIFAEQICKEYEESAKARGTGIAKRNPDYVINKMIDGKSIIAFHKDGRWAGYCYIETWSHGEYVANSGLIVNPEFRKFGLASDIKENIFKLSRKKFPNAKIFGITTSLAVMKINSKLGYKPVTFSELTQDDNFWKGCSSCPNVDILERNKRKMCLCTGMLYDDTKKSFISKLISEAKHLILGFL